MKEKIFNYLISVKEEKGSGYIVLIYPDKNSEKKLEEKITSKTRAIIPIHLYGQCADMDPIIDLQKSHGSWLVDARDGKEYLVLFSLFASLPVARNRTSLLLMSAVNVINGLFPVYTSLYVVIKASVPL